MMDTPDKNRIAAVSVRNFEESPVSQYINNLSPIEVVKSLRTDHILNSLALDSPSSLFNSPHINFHKESRFSIGRHQSPDVSDSRLLHDGTVHNSRGVEVAASVAAPCDEWLKWATPRSLDKDAKPETSFMQFDLNNEMPRALKSASDGCSIQMVSCDEISTRKRNKNSRAGKVTELYNDKLKQQLEKNKHEDRSDVARFSPDVVDRLVNKTKDQTIVDPRTSSFIESGSSHSCGKESMARAPDVLLNDPQNNLSGNDLNLKTSRKEERCLQPSRKQRSIRRRCLVFEMAGTYRAKLVCDPTNSSVTPLTSNGGVPSLEKQLVTSKLDVDDAISMPRGVGQHLNDIINTSNHGNKLTTAGYVLSPSPRTSHQNPGDESLTPTSLAKDSVSCDEFMDEAPVISTKKEHFDIDTPMGRRCRPENAWESGSCKRCNCRRSKCLKLYCDCFAAGLYCIEHCSCQDCFNKPIHEDIVMNTRRQIEDRNPLAFAPKVVTSVDSPSDFGDKNKKTPASARHKKGCNCRKSNCLKRYCECFLMGVGCSPNCRCNGCKNSFGQKDEDCKREDATEKNSHDGISTKNEQGDRDRPMVHSSLISSEELLVSPQLSAHPDLRTLSLSQSGTKSESHPLMISEDEASEIPDNTQIPFLKSVPPFPSLCHENKKIIKKS